MEEYIVVCRCDMGYQGGTCQSCIKHPGKKINTIYTYNEDTVLSQDIQFVYGGDVFENDVIALSIHNGCDARGGLTDYKFFKIDWDSFLNYSSDYYDQEDTKKMYVEARA